MRSQTVTHSAFDAIADPTRRAVLDLLRGGAQPAGRIAKAFPISRPAVSRHLRLLRRSRLVLEQRRGRERLYTLNPEPLRLVDDWLSGYRTFWGARLASLKAYVESGAREPRGKRRGRKKGGPS
jgi:DNA-binding transcriptional ArsR family regulator